MSEEAKELMVEFDRRYSRMQNFLLSIIGIILAASLSVGAIQISSWSATKERVLVNESDIAYILENSVSQKAIDLLIESFNNQTEIIDRYFPDDIKGAMIEFQKVSADLRKKVLIYNSNLNTRGFDK
jgi:hypothetical protein